MARRSKSRGRRKGRISIYVPPPTRPVPQYTPREGWIERPGANIGQVDPRLRDIMSRAAERWAAAHPGYGVMGTSGKRPRKSTPWHPGGIGLDYGIIDPGGALLDNYQNPRTFRMYEEIAQEGRRIQQQDYPELDANFRFGGYFGGTKPFDQMHVDLGPTSAMTQGSWEHGLNESVTRRGKMKGALSIGMNEQPQQEVGRNVPVPTPRPDYAPPASVNTVRPEGPVGGLRAPAQTPMAGLAPGFIGGAGANELQRNPDLGGLLGRPSANLGLMPDVSRVDPSRFGGAMTTPKTDRLPSAVSTAPDPSRFGGLLSPVTTPPDNTTTMSGWNMTPSVTRPELDRWAQTMPDTSPIAPSAAPVTLPERAPAPTARPAPLVAEQVPTPRARPANLSRAALPRAPADASIFGVESVTGTPASVPTPTSRPGRSWREDDAGLMRGDYGAEYRDLDEPTFPDAPTIDEPMFSPETEWGARIGGFVGGLPGLLGGAALGRGIAGLGGLMGNRPGFDRAVPESQRFSTGSGLEGIANALGGARGATGRSLSNPGMSVTSLGNGQSLRRSDRFGWTEVIGPSGEVRGIQYDEPEKKGLLGRVSSFFGSRFGQGNRGLSSAARAGISRSKGGLF